MPEERASPANRFTFSFVITEPNNLNEPVAGLARVLDAYANKASEANAEGNLKATEGTNVTWAGFTWKEVKFSATE